MGMRCALMILLLGVAAMGAGAQESAPPAPGEHKPKEDQQQDQQKDQQQEPPRAEAQRPAGWSAPGAPPRSQPEARPYSSSRDTEAEFERPTPEAAYQPGPGSTPPVGGVHELRPYNPHRAMKNVEIGEYYLKRRRYPAALSRFREALEHKPNDAHATYRLAETLEKMGELEEALEMYHAYLRILPEGGRFSQNAQRAVQRLEEKLNPAAEGASAASARRP